MWSVFLLFNYCRFFTYFLHIFYNFFTYISYYIPAICNFIWRGKYSIHLVLGGANVRPLFLEGQMSAHSFSGRGKCPPLFFQEGANVLPLVLGKGKCRGGGNVRLPSQHPIISQIISEVR